MEIGENRGTTSEQKKIHIYKRDIFYFIWNKMRFKYENLAKN